MATKQGKQADTKPIHRECPHCGGESIKFGKQVWTEFIPKRTYIEVQRYRCKVCLRLWYRREKPLTVATGIQLSYF